MPPRLRLSQSPLLIASSKSPICPTCRLQARSFSEEDDGTPNPGYERKARKIKTSTAARQKLYAWLGGPGAHLKRPRVNSTNYLGSYNRDGSSMRTGEAASEASEAAEAANADPAQKKSEQENPDDKKEPNEKIDQAGVDADGKPTCNTASETAPSISPETLEDLRPFPLNRYFRSQSVLSLPFREEIYSRIADKGHTIRQVSVALNVSVERVAAVYRLKEVEKRWFEEDKQLNVAYERTVMGMLPQTPYVAGAKAPFHESINDLPVHPKTLTQMFLPTSESRQFTRVDAGRAFHPKLLPAEDRIPHPEMVAMFKDGVAGFTRSEQRTRMEQRFKDMQKAEDERADRARRAEERHVKVVTTNRYDFRFRDANTELAGRNGRGRHGVGWRYGAALLDRNKDIVRIPTKVD